MYFNVSKQCHFIFPWTEKLEPSEEGMVVFNIVVLPQYKNVLCQMSWKLMSQYEHVMS